MYRAVSRLSGFGSGSQEHYDRGYVPVMYKECLAFCIVDDNATLVV